MIENEIDVIKSLKEKYKNISLNESDTRFKIIDKIISDVLKWPDANITTEKYIEGNRADYVLKSPSGKAIFVVESKSNGVYFELPKNLNSKNTFQKITVDKLISDNNIKDAIFQVKEYAEDLICPYACVCNGDTWIIFKTISHSQPWKKLPAFVIKNIDFFSNNYKDAINVLGYNSITSNNSLIHHIGVSKKTYPEIFYPKNNITVYNTSVNSNRYAGPLQTISRKYLGIIPEDDAEFMTHCYVSNKGEYDKLQKNVQGFLHDSLTPYFTNLGFRDFSDDKKGGAFGLRIEKIIKQEKLNNVMILFGGRGAGKSTFLKRFLFHVKPKEIQRHSHIALVGLLNSAQTAEQLTSEIWQKTLVGIDKDKLRKSSREELLTLFDDEYEILKKQILVGLREDDAEYQRLLRGFLTEKINDAKLFCEKLSTKLKDNNTGLIIFLDNMDQLPPNLQDVCFLTAEEMSERLNCLVIVSMREERYYNAKGRGVLDAYKNPGFHLASPVIPEVVVKRVEYIISKLKETPDIDTEFGIKSITHLNTLLAFFEICKDQLNVKSSPLSYFLRYATHGDVRQALEFFEGFLTSGYTNINEIAERRNFFFQNHQVIKPMMIPNRFFYDEQRSKIPNIYQLRNDIDSSHFTGLRILHSLNNKRGDIGSNGFIDVKHFIQNFEDKYSLKEDCIKNISLFLEKGLVESSNRLEEFSDEIDQIKLTAFGNYIFNDLAFNFAYLDLVSLDCGLFDEKLSNYFISCAPKELGFYYESDFMSRIKLRLERVDKFVKYISDLEDQEFIDLGLDSSDIKFSVKLNNALEEQKSRILKSANNKLKAEDY